MKEMLMKRMLSRATPSETETVTALAGIIAAVEAEQSAAVSQLIEATNDGEPVGDVDVIDAEARTDELLSVADAISDDRLAEFYFTEMSNLPNGEEAVQYAGLGTGEMWENKKRDWYLRYYREGVVDVDPNDADADLITEVAENHIGEVWGVSLPVFRAEVLEWSQGAALESILAGPVQSHTAAVASIADGLEGDDDGDDHA